MGIDNLKKPDNKKWKLIADIALYILPIELVAVTSLPLSASAVYWIGFTLTQATVIFKAISKLTTDETAS